jgi:hypothetical protein
METFHLPGKNKSEPRDLWMVRHKHDFFVECQPSLQVGYALIISQLRVAKRIIRLGRSDLRESRYNCQSRQQTSQFPKATQQAHRYFLPIPNSEEYHSKALLDRAGKVRVRAIRPTKKSGAPKRSALFPATADNF